MQQKLAPYIDTSTRPWSFRPVEGLPLGGDVGSLPQFQRAAVIRETFFIGGQGPATQLTFKPVEMDAGLKEFVLDVDGQIVRYDHGPQIPQPVRVARAAWHGRGAGVGAASGHGHGSRRSVGPVPPLRARQPAARQRRPRSSARASTSTAARWCSRSPPAACATRCACPSCVASACPERTLTRSGAQAGTHGMHADTSPGWYGKLAQCWATSPRAGWSRTWVRSCDAVAQQRPAREPAKRWANRNGRSAYLAAPVWRFAWGPGIVDARWWFGVLMPSCDNVGRYYPLLIAQPRQQPPMDRVALDHLEAWWSQLARAGLATLTVDGATLECVRGRI